MTDFYLYPRRNENSPKALLEGERDIILSMSRPESRTSMELRRWVKDQRTWWFASALKARRRTAEK